MVLRTFTPPSGRALLWAACVLSLGVFLRPASRAHGVDFEDVGVWARDSQVAVCLWMLFGRELASLLRRPRSRALSHAIVFCSLFCVLMPVYITVTCLQHFHDQLVSEGVRHVTITPGIACWLVLVASAAGTIGVVQAIRSHGRAARYGAIDGVQTQSA